MVVEMCAWPISCCRAGRDIPARTISAPKLCRLSRMRHSRHSFATEMLRLGVSLPALMRLLGHKDIRMTLRYVAVTQQDLQREFHQARQNAGHLHLLPALAFPKDIPSAGLPAICQALE